MTLDDLDINDKEGWHIKYCIRLRWFLVKHWCRFLCRTTPHPTPKYCVVNMEGPLRQGLNVNTSSKKKYMLLSNLFCVYCPLYYSVVPNSHDWNSLYLCWLWQWIHVIALASALVQDPQFMICITYMCVYITGIY